MKKGDKSKKVFGLILILAIIVSVFGGAVSAEDVSRGLKQSVDDEEIQTAVGDLSAQACGDMGVNPVSWSPTINCDESDNEIVTVSASSGIVNGVTVSKISGPTWLSASPTNLDEIASGSSKTFTMIASPPLGTSGDFGYTVRVSTTCGSPSTTDVSGTIHVDCSAPNQPPSYSNPSVSPGSGTLSTPPFGGWLVLDGLDDYAEAEDHFELDVGDQIGESMTVEAWVNFEPFRTAEIIRKLGAYGLSTRAWSTQGYRYRCLVLWLCNKEMIACTTQYGGGFHIPGWHHVAGVFDAGAGEARVYMDGEQLMSASVGSVENTTDPLRIGESVPGMVDEVRISDVARYTGSTYPVPTSPFTCDEHTRALWHFDEFEGATVFHDVGGMVDNLLVGYNGAHTEGVQGQACEDSDNSCGIYPDCENCDEKDGCYVYGNGCEERDYYCKSNEEGCGYTYSNRHTDDWMDTGNTKWVSDPGNECQEKERKEQEYRDYYCSGGTCTYSVTDTQWIDTGNTREKPDSGVFRNGRWILRICNPSGAVLYSFRFGRSTDIPVTGDWDGDGVDTIGVYRNGRWLLRNSNSAGPPDYSFRFGRSTDIPVTGDWDGDGVDTIGVRRNARWLLRNSNSAGSPDLRFKFGRSTDIPVTGDWNGDGIDTIGVRRAKQWILRNSNSAGSLDYRFRFGRSTDIPVTDDWNGDSVDTIGVRRGKKWILRDSNSAGSPDYSFKFGRSTDIPVTGDWNGA